jgi:hypothetical protein
VARLNTSLDVSKHELRGSRVFTCVRAVRCEASALMTHGGSLSRPYGGGGTPANDRGPDPPGSSNGSLLCPSPGQPVAGQRAAASPRRRRLLGTEAYSQEGPSARPRGSQAQKPRRGPSTHAQGPRVSDPAHPVFIRQAGQAGVARSAGHPRIHLSSVSSFLLRQPSGIRICAVRLCGAPPQNFAGKSPISVGRLRSRSRSPAPTPARHGGSQGYVLQAARPMIALPGGLVAPRLRFLWVAGGGGVLCSEGEREFGISGSVEDLGLRAAGAVVDER